MKLLLTSACSTDSTKRWLQLHLQLHYVLRVACCYVRTISVFLSNTVIALSSLVRSSSSWVFDVNKRLASLKNHSKLFKNNIVRITVAYTSRNVENILFLLLIYLDKLTGDRSLHQSKLTVAKPQKEWRLLGPCAVATAEYCHKVLFG